MSLHSGQKSRRLASPSSTTTRVYGPIRATKSFGLSSPLSEPLSLSSSSSQLTTNQLSGCDAGKRRSSSSTTVWTEKLVGPSCTGFTKEKKSMQSPVEVTIRRSASYDAIASSYLCGTWPRSSRPTIHLDHCPVVLTADKWTQTTDDATEDSEMDATKRRERPTTTTTTAQVTSLDMKSEVRSRLWPLTRGVSSTGSDSCISDGSESAYSVVGETCPVPRSMAIMIPVARRHNQLVPCQGSAEGFNQEIETLVHNTGILNGSHELLQVRPLTPDGHRAPIADLLNKRRNVDTQTPSGGSGGGPFNSGIEKHFLRIPGDSSDDSPSLPIIPGAIDSTLLLSRPSSTESEKSDEYDNRTASGDESPDPFLQKLVMKREAPEGCETIGVEFGKTNENVKRESYHAPMKTTSLLKCIIPSEGSAFCPLLKKMCHADGSGFLAVKQLFK